MSLFWCFHSPSFSLEDPNIKGLLERVKRTSLKGAPSSCVGHRNISVSCFPSYGRPSFHSENKKTSADPEKVMEKCTRSPTLII